MKIFYNDENESTYTPLSLFKEVINGLESGGGQSLPEVGWRLNKREGLQKKFFQQFGS